MAEPKEDGLVKSVETLLADKEALVVREKKLIEDLNGVLAKMGYKVVSTRTGAHTATGAHAAGAGTGKKLGRPPGS